MRGPSLASALIEEVDQLVLKVNPFPMGAGKSLFARPLAKIEARTQSRRDYKSGFALILGELAQ